SEQVSAVLDGVARGQLAPDVARLIIDSIKSSADVRATEELEARIAALEEARDARAGTGMAIINTERNRVHAHAIGDDDVFVRISLLGYDEAGARVVRHSRYEPITEYQAAVDWAVSMADVMAHPIHVVPLNGD
ncbi:hypothetical protein OY671_011810, partial [Metschnikowia pulcherrima]